MTMYFGFQDMTIAYGDNRIVDQVTVGFERGCITTLVGRNGCGKSSLLRTLTDGVKPVSGTPILDDRPLRLYSRRTRARRLAVLPQTPLAPPDLIVRTLVSYGRYPYQSLTRRESDEDRAIIARAIHESGLESLADRTLSTLSGGERQRSWIAMTICQEPEILVLDEPTTHLDISHQLEVLELIQRLQQRRGMTVVLVLHDLNLAARFSDRIVVLSDRRISQHGTPADVLTQQTIAETFGVDSCVIPDPVSQTPHYIPIRRIEP